MYADRKRPKGGLPRVSPKVQERLREAQAELESFNLTEEDYSVGYGMKGAVDIPPKRGK